MLWSDFFFSFLWKWRSDLLGNKRNDLWNWFHSWGENGWVLCFFNVHMTKTKPNLLSEIRTQDCFEQEGDPQSSEDSLESLGKSWKADTPIIDWQRTNTWFSSRHAFLRMATRTREHLENLFGIENNLKINNEKQKCEKLLNYMWNCL